MGRVYWHVRNGCGLAFPSAATLDSLTLTGDRMTDEQYDKHRRVALYVAENIPQEEKSAVKAWLAKLLEIREANLPAHWKAKAAIAATIESKVALPLIKTVASQAKALGWDNRTPAQRIGLAAAAVGLATFSSTGAGIAALGGAIGLPLWVVLGAGSMFAKYLYDDLSQSLESAAQETGNEEDQGPVINVTPITRGD